MGIEEFLLERATKEGIEKGEKKGELGGKRKMAKRLKELGVSLDIIAQSSGLSMEELKDL